MSLLGEHPDKRQLALGVFATEYRTSPFIRGAAACLSDEERFAFIDYIARHPEAGKLIAGTGGARKVRWARDGGGKSGGVRTIYYYHDQDAPLFLLTVYAKNERANLSAADRNAIKVAIGGIRTLIRANRVTA